MEITRQSLYEALWSTPRKELASVLGVDQNAITDASKQHNIPLPKQGHWTLVSMGKSPSQPSLNGDLEKTVILHSKPRKPRKKKPALDNPKSRTQKAQASDQMATIPSEPVSTNQSPATSISETLPAVRKAHKTYSSPKAKRDYKYQHVLPGSANVLRIAVMPEMVDRALLLMDVILREFQKSHWKVHIPSAKDFGKNSVIVDDVEILFTITEHRRQERIKSENTWRDWEYRYHSTGTLRFQFGVEHWMQEIKDNKRKRLEDQIPGIINGIVGEVVRIKKAEVERNNRERIDRLKSRLSGLVRKAIDFNEECEKNLEQYLSQHEEALRIRKLVNSIKQAGFSNGALTEQEHWVAWLEKRADSIDPALQVGSLDFSIPKELKSQVSEMIEADLGSYAPLKELDLESAIHDSARLIKLQKSWSQK
jgi:hypothetical protein